MHKVFLSEVRKDSLKVLLNGFETVLFSCAFGFRMKLVVRIGLTVMLGRNCLKILRVGGII